jgi:predicted permease
MGLFRKMKNSFAPQPVRQDADDELAFHLEQRTRENVRRGMTPEAARADARKRLGNPASLREETAEADVVLWVDTLKRDLRLAFRTLRNAPVFMAMAVLSLMLGIGANTTVFTVMKHVVMDSLPVPHPEQLVILHNKGVSQGWTFSDGMRSSFSYPQYKDLNAATGSIFTGVLARFSTTVTLAGTENSEHVRCDLVSGNYFDVLEVKPWRGRLLTGADDKTPGAHPVTVLSYGLWQRSFGGDPNIVGRTVRLNSHPYVVAGVTPPGFYGINIGISAELYVPMMMKAQITPTWNGLADRTVHWCNLVARLKPGTDIAHAQSGLRVIYPPVRDQDLVSFHSPSANFLKQFAKNTVDLTPGGKGYAEIREGLQEPLRFLAVMVLVVLLITVMNVANLLLARATAKQREMAIRLAVGAGRVALVRQLFVESCLLAIVGGTLGVLLAYVATPALLHLLPNAISETSINAKPDSGILLLTAALTLLSGIAFGLLPAWQASRTDVSGAIKAEASLGHTSGRLWLRRVLVAGQIAFSLILLSAAMLFARSLRNLQNLSPGFRTNHLVTFKVDPGQAGYSQEQIKTFGEEIRKRIAALSNVENAATALLPVLEDTDAGGNITVEGYRPTARDDEESRWNWVSPAYFTTLHIPLLAGRTVTEADTLPSSKVAVVNATFVKHFLGGRNPIGARFALRGGDRIPLDWTVVGVVADSEHSKLRSPIQPFIYMPYLVDKEISELIFYVRTRGHTETVMPEIRTLVKRYDASLPVYDMKTMNDLIKEGLFTERGLGMLSTLFAALATLLAAVGLYGVMSYSVTRRIREFGVRMAVGATPRRISQMVLRETALIGLAGIVCALPFVFAAGRLIRSSLYGVQASDPLVLGGAVLLLLFVAEIAGAIPARHAAKIDPHTALRSE